MPFTVDYGPISGAMQLATAGGQAQAQRTGFSEDMQAVAALQNAQRLAQSERATEIQASLQNQQLGIEDQRNQAQNQLAQAELASRTAYNNANLNAMSSYRQGMLGNQMQRTENQGQYWQGRNQVSQQNADTRSQQVNDMDAFHQMMAGIQQQNANTKAQGVQQQGVQGQDKQLADYYNALDGRAKAIEANAARTFSDPNADPNYQQIKAQMQKIQESMRQAMTSGQQQQPAANPQMTRQISQSGGVPQQAQNMTPGQPPVQIGQGPAQPQSQGVIDPNTAARYIAAVGGDPRDPNTILKAKAAAAADGWTVPGYTGGQVQQQQQPQMTPQIPQAMNGGLSY